jgi:hypothetical protein
MYFRSSGSRASGIAKVTEIGDLIDDHERRLIVGAHEVALVHHQRAGASADRCGDRRVLQLHFRVLDRSLVGIDGRVQGRDRGTRGVHLLACGDSSLRELVKALGLLRGICGLSDVAIEVRLRLLQRRFERTTVQREQDLARHHVVAFGEVDAGQLARGLRANGDARERLGRANHADFDRHGLLHHGANRDGYRGTAASTAASSPVTGAPRSGGALLAGTTGTDQEQQNTGNNEGSGSHDEISVRWIWADFSRTGLVLDWRILNRDRLQ